MPFNAAAFRSKLQFGGQRGNSFEVSITFPVAPGVPGDPSNEFTFMCQGAQAPGFNVGSADAFYFGRRVSFNGDRSFDDWTVEVINDEDFPVRGAFESWSNRLHLLDHDTNQADKFQGQPVYSQAKIKMFGKDGRVTKEYTLYNAFPINVSPMELNWQDVDNIQRFTATFRFDYFTTDKIARLGG